MTENGGVGKGRRTSGPNVSVCVCAACLCY